MDEFRRYVYENVVQPRVKIYLWFAQYDYAIVEKSTEAEATRLVRDWERAGCPATVGQFEKIVQVR